MPFDVCLRQISGKELDTRAKAEAIHSTSVLFHDREERAGVKHNDADLIGCPIRIAAGEKVSEREW